MADDDFRRRTDAGDLVFVHAASMDASAARAGVHTGDCPWRRRQTAPVPTGLPHWQPDLEMLTLDAAALSADDGNVSEEQPPASRVGHFAFRVDALAEVQALHRRLQADARVETVNPVTHGNAWSLYFADPEGNGIEVFCDSPWHVRQPQGGAWDPAAAPDRIRETTEAAFAGVPGFGSIEHYYAERASQLAERQASRGATDPHAGG